MTLLHMWVSGPVGCSDVCDLDQVHLSYKICQLLSDTWRGLRGTEEWVEDKDPSRVLVLGQNLLRDGTRSDNSAPGLVVKVFLSPDNMSPFPLRTEVLRFQHRTRTDGHPSSVVGGTSGSEGTENGWKRKTTARTESCRPVIKVMPISD